MKKMKRTHILQVNEPYEFSGPNGKREFEVKGLGVIPGPKAEHYGKEFYLLEVCTPFEMDGELVKQFICAPRYQGDTIDMVVNSECTVGIARVKEGVSLNEGGTFVPSEVEYCAIGSIKQTA